MSERDCVRPQRHIENEYHNRIELCVAYVTGGLQQKMTIEAAGIDTERSSLTITGLIKQAMDIYMNDFTDVSVDVVRIAYTRRMNQKKSTPKTKARKLPVSAKGMSH